MVHGADPRSLRERVTDHPNTVFLALERQQARDMNLSILQALFGARRGGSWMRTVGNAGADQLPAVPGARYLVTVNISKGEGVVNGAMGSLMLLGTGYALLQRSTAWGNRRGPQDRSSVNQRSTVPCPRQGPSLCPPRRNCVLTPHALARTRRSPWLRPPSQVGSHPGLPAMPAAKCRCLPCLP